MPVATVPCLERATHVSYVPANGAMQLRQALTTEVQAAWLYTMQQPPVAHLPGCNVERIRAARDAPQQAVCGGQGHLVKLDGRVLKPALRHSDTHSVQYLTPDRKRQ
jgi:hypothetical protein